MPLSEAATATPPAGSHRCTGCAGGVLRRDTVSTALWQDDRLLVVEGIPALVCQSCGERYFEDETAMALDMMRGRREAGESPARVMSVPVYAFSGSKQPGGKAGGS